LPSLSFSLTMTAKFPILRNPKNLGSLKKSSIELEFIHKLLKDNDIEGLRSLISSFQQGKSHFNPKKLKNMLNHLDGEGQAPIHIAMKSPQTLIVKLFMDLYKSCSQYEFDLNLPDSYGFTPLHLLVTNNDIAPQVVKEFLEEFPEIDVSIGNRDKNTPLHYFCKCFHSAMHCHEIGLLLISRGGRQSVNSRNVYGETPMHKAIFNESVRLLMLEMLIENGADINAQTDQKETCLGYAVRLQRKDLISVLLAAGADINIPGCDGKTPLEISSEYPNSPIHKHLRKVQDLMTWANQENIDPCYANLFLKEELYLDMLREADEALLDHLKIEKAGARMKILAACKKIPESGQLSTFPDLNRLQLEECESVSTSLFSIDIRKALAMRKDGVISNNIDDLLINKNDLEFTKMLGEGTSGKVFKGIYKKRQDVAIKVLKSLSEAEEFKKEFLIISSVQSPYIVKFYGACLEPQLAMVMEYCSRGSLYSLMNDKSISFDWNMFFRIASCICQAIHCLHSWSPSILHRDLKSLNLLVRDNMDVLLADFGLSRFAIDSNTETLMKVCGTAAYTAPEVFVGNDAYGPACDVFSIAMILWELIVRVITGVYQRPYSEYPNLLFDFHIIPRVCGDGLRPTLPSTTPETLSRIVLNAWDQEPSKRPTSASLLKSLEDAKEEYNANKSNWDTLISEASVKRVSSSSNSVEAIASVKPTANNPTDNTNNKDNTNNDVHSVNSGSNILENNTA